MKRWKVKSGGRQYEIDFKRLSQRNLAARLHSRAGTDEAFYPRPRLSEFPEKGQDAQHSPESKSYQECHQATFRKAAHFDMPYYRLENKGCVGVCVCAFL